MVVDLRCHEKGFVELWEWAMCALAAGTLCAVLNCVRIWLLFACLSGGGGREGKDILQNQSA